MTEEQLHETILDYYGEDEGILLADGLHEACLGVTYDMAISKHRAVYSIRKAIDVLVESGMQEEEAEEYLEYNTIQAYVGPNTPIWLNDDMMS